MSLHVKDTTWKKAAEVFVRSGGNWVPALSVSGKQTTWKETHARFGLAGFSYASKSLLLSVSPAGMDISPDGTKLLHTNYLQSDFYQYTLSTPDNISTGGSLVRKAVAGGFTGVRWGDSGNKIYAISNNRYLRQYPLSTPYSVASLNAVGVVVKDLSAQDTTMYGLAVSPDGTQVFVTGDDNNKIYRYSMSAWDLNTLTYEDCLDVSAKDLFPRGPHVLPWGNRLVFCGTGTDKAYSYYMFPEHDLSTGVYVDEIDLGPGGSPSLDNPRAMTFNADWTKMYIADGNDNTVYQYGA